MLRYLFLLILPIAFAACNNTKNTTTNKTTDPKTDNALKCDSPNPAVDIPWIKEFADNLTGSSVQAKITRYKLDGTYYFEVNNCVNCSDAMTVLYTCDHAKKCETGGIAGLRTCGDFYDKADKGVLVWKNFKGPDKSKF